MTENKAKDGLICSQCHYENKRGAKKCARCGARLITTIPLPDSPPQQPNTIRLTGDVTLPTSLKPETILLSIAGFPQPVFIKGTSEIILGRYIPDEPQDVVDLTKYNAHLLGVSRRHALIRVLHDKYSIEDLGSANGTWLNENRLEAGRPYPLSGGDQIRLGQLILFITISTISSVYLLDSGGTMASNRRLTPHDLSAQIGPYLQALSDIQLIVNEVLGQTPRDIGINTISVHAEHCVHIKLDRALETLQLVQDQVVPWKEAHADEIAQFLAAGASPEMKGTAHAKKKTVPDDVDAAFHEAEIDLARNLIRKVVPALANYDQEPYLQRLCLSLDTLLLSPIEISDSPPESN